MENIIYIPTKYKNKKISVIYLKIIFGRFNIIIVILIVIGIVVVVVDLIVILI
jgi:hypothetical protein